MYMEICMFMKNMLNDCTVLDVIYVVLVVIAVANVVHVSMLNISLFEWICIYEFMFICMYIYMSHLLETSALVVYVCVPRNCFPKFV